MITARMERMGTGKDRARPRLLFVALGAAALLAVFIASRLVCIPAWIKKGVVVRRCPEGELRQTLAMQCEGLRRGGEGAVHVQAYAHYTTGEADEHLVARVRRLEPRLFLVAAGGKETPLQPVKGWHTDDDHGRSARLALPGDLPDGDYQLRARVRSPIGEGTVELALPLFAPARIHVITDRPLYQPGNDVQFRAVALRATDFAPLDGRPGKWVVHDPSGEVVLEEKAPAASYGVVAGSFPLDAGAPAGEWRVRWVSGGTEDAVGFRVEPFSLPRFRVEASAGKPFYRAGERPTMRGKVVYSSGAPVRDAAVELTWSGQGAWPLPTEWTGGGALPRKASTDRSGAFELTLPAVPADLRGRVTLAARIGASDAAGDRVEGSASVQLSEDALQVAAVTELDDGLVQGFNNRLYLRATTAAGAVLAKTELTVKRAWEPNDRGVVTTTDEDGVASLQIDPGPPVNVVVPAMPVRPPPRPPAVTRGEVDDLLAGSGPSLADQRAMDGWHGAIAPCARFVGGNAEDVEVAVRAAPSGAVTATATDGGPLGTCVARAVAGRRLAAGRDRLFQIEYRLTFDLARLEAEVQGAPKAPDELKNAAVAGARDAQVCLAEDAAAAGLPRVLVWELRAPRKSPSVSFVPDPDRDETVVSAAVAACVERRVAAALARAEVDDLEGAQLLGHVRLSVIPSERQRQARPAATTMLGYELAISARQPQETLTTKLVLRPGQVPPVRLRASTVLAEPGGKVAVTVLRGPGFRGELPRELWMTHPRRSSIKAEVDAQSRTAHFTMPGDASGWFQVAWNAGRALVYVRPRAELAVTVTPEAKRYQPGQTATLAVKTSAGGRGTPAAVGLVGVDASLAQLVPLPGADDLARLRPRPTMNAPAFGALDATALEMGRIRGAQAAAATILRVASLPAPATLDASVSAQVEPSFEPLEALTDHFYNVLGELHAQVREWEGKARRGEQMRPATMAGLWTAALAACEKRKQGVTDAYGRRLRLHWLPSDLLALTDPRAVVVDGTRLPEDVESWPAWVAKERP